MMRPPELEQPADQSTGKPPARSFAPSVWASGAATGAALTGAFWLSGTLVPTELPAYASSPLQITGMALMLILIPTYFVVAGQLAPKRSLELVHQLRPQIPDPEAADDAAAAIANSLRRVWVPGLLGGLVLGLFNTNPIHALTQSSSPAVEISISLGQLVLWMIVGLTLGMRFVSARAFSGLGALVDFDLFQLERLRPLAKSGMVDVALVAGALALTPIQALDAEFRWYNYRFGLLVALPTGLVALLWPLWTIHRRIRLDKQVRIAELDRLIDASSSASTQSQLTQLESLLAHRDRVRDVRTWLLSTALISRVFFYLVIPPLAWAGAALVELMIDRLIAA
jgi:hypothetical protein